MARITKTPDERRRELMACAKALFYRKGYESTSVNDIVNEIGVAKGTFYHYFDSKQAILQEMVDELVSQQLALLRDIIADETLTAIPKWVRAFQVMGNWKTERQSEMIAMLRMMRQDENILFQHTIRQTAIRQTAPEIARIIAQGVAEGVFATEFAGESAEIALAIMQTFADSFADIILHPRRGDDRASLARRQLAATQTAVERVINAPPGSLPIMEAHTFAAWFEQAVANGVTPPLEGEVNQEELS